MSERIGFYICHCGINIASRVRCDEVAADVGRMPGVVVAREHMFMCSDPGQEQVERDIAERGLTRVVVASCSPRMHEATFRAVTARAGLNPFRAFHHVCVREHVSWVHDDEDLATHKARVLSRAGVQRVAQQHELSPERFPVNPATLVVGGGIAGMQAALDIASAGYKVHLVERASTLGGRMLQLDKTFPTLDCAACIGTPKMVAVAQHPNIELHTFSEVEALSGFIGNFRATVRRRARHVDAARCTGCGDCAEVCLVHKPSEWDAGTRLRGAVFRPFPQAVPITYLIDKRDRGPCVQACPAGTNVQGYVALIREGLYQEAVELMLERIPFPGTLGRVCPAPCEDDCRRREVDTPLAIRCLKRFAADQVDWDALPLPKITPRIPAQKVAVIGAGPAGLSAAAFLARAGYPVTVFEASEQAGGMLRAGIPDFRLPPEVLDREVRYIQRLGVRLRLGTPVGRDLSVDSLFEQGFAAVFAATGAHGDARLGLDGEDAAGVISGVAILRRVNLTDAPDVGEDVVVIGGGAVAMDAARTALRVGADRVRVYCLEGPGEMPAWADEVRGAEEEGVQINHGRGPARLHCPQGRISGLSLKRCTRVLDEHGRFAPAYDAGDLVEVTCDTLIVAIGQAPDPAWAEGSRDLPLDAAGRLRADLQTFATERPGLFAGGELTTGPSLVVRAVANGRQAAISMDRYLRGEDLRDGRPDAPGGQRWDPIPGGARPEERAHPPLLPLDRREGFAEVEQALSASQATREAARCVACGACAECMRCAGACEADAIAHQQQDELLDLSVGSVIVATGFDPMDPAPMRRQYGHGVHANVLTNMEFERMCNATGPTGGQVLLREAPGGTTYSGSPRSVAILHCIGSRDARFHPHCSRTCCMVALKYAHLLKDRVGHDVEVYNFYIDMRCFGKGYEEFFQRVQDEGVHMIRGKAAAVTLPTDEDDEEEGELVVVAEDTLSARLLRVPVDMAILCTAMEARADAPEVARVFGLTTGPDGFFLEEHPKLEPVSTSTAGVYVAGACQGPKDIPDSVAQAKAAASMAQALATRGEVEVSPLVSGIDPDLCAGCRTCVAVCPYSAIELDLRTHRSWVNRAVCKGCGSCSAVCPSGAAQVDHFTRRQLFHEIEGLLAAMEVP